MEIPYLPPEILTNIFSRLPVKTLSNVRFVNKYWFHYISGPDFAEAHLKRSKNDKKYSGHRVIFAPTSSILSFEQFSIDSLMCCCSSDSINLFNYVVDPKKWYDRLQCYLVGSCNGLVCIASTTDNQVVVVLNPCTLKYNRLPPLYVDEERCKQIVDFTYGFGYDEATDDYKVVALCLLRGWSFRVNVSYRSAVNVYSLKSGAWRRIHHDFLGGVLDSDMGVFASGKVHWFTDDGFDECWQTKIVAFDVESETFGRVEHPNYDRSWSYRILDVLDGCICLLLEDVDEINVDLWVMTDYGVEASWVKTVTVSCVSILRRPNAFTPRSVLPNGEILFDSMDTFAVYNPKDGSFRFPSIKRLKSCFGPLVYVQSLVSPVGTERRGRKKAKLV